MYFYNIMSKVTLEKKPNCQEKKKMVYPFLSHKVNEI